MHDLGAVQLAADPALAIDAAGRDNRAPLAVAFLAEEIELELRSAHRAEAQIGEALTDVAEYDAGIVLPRRAVLGIQLQEKLGGGAADPRQRPDGLLEGVAESVTVAGLAAQGRNVAAPDVAGDGGQRHLELAFQHLVDGIHRQPLAAVDAVEVGQHHLDDLGFRVLCEVLANRRSAGVVCAHVGLMHCLREFYPSCRFSARPACHPRGSRRATP